MTAMKTLILGGSMSKHSNALGALLADALAEANKRGGFSPHYDGLDRRRFLVMPNDLFNKDGGREAPAPQPGQDPEPDLIEHIDGFWVHANSPAIRKVTVQISSTIEVAAYKYQSDEDVLASLDQTNELVANILPGASKLDLSVVSDQPAEEEGDFIALPLKAVTNAKLQGDTFSDAAHMAAEAIVNGSYKERGRPYAILKVLKVVETAGPPVIAEPRNLTDQDFE